MSKANSRHGVIELLWELKKCAEQSQIYGVSFIHFNLMLRDTSYRNNIIEKACSCSDEKLQTLGRALSEANVVGKLLGADDEHLNQRVLDDTPSKPVTINQPRLLIAMCLIIVTAIGLYMLPLINLFKSTQPISENIVEDTTWSAGNSYLLKGLIYVEQGARLTIEEGVTVKGTKGSALIVTREAQIYANGTAEAPIVFTSNLSKGSRNAGDWGGLVLLGNAVVNKENAFIEGIPKEDVRGFFGGNDDAHSCGVLKYVRIEFSGYEVYANNELNGLTLAGCGSNTIVRHLQVHRSLDDGIEIFGGTVDIKYAVISGAGDDSFDWDMGWRGRVQHLVVQQHENIGDNGFEGDNAKADNDALPRSAPQFYNVTMVSPRSSAKAQRAMTIRAGSAGSFHNFVIEGFSQEAVDLRDRVAALVADGRLNFGHMYLADIGDNRGSFYSHESGDSDDDFGFDEVDFFINSKQQIHHQDVKVLSIAAQSPTQPDFSVLPHKLINTAYGSIPQGEFWNESARYMGAIKPGASNSWLSGWTQFPES